jgi:hypothetical protein
MAILLLSWYQHVGFLQQQQCPPALGKACTFAQEAYPLRCWYKQHTLHHLHSSTMLGPVRIIALHIETTY